MFAWRPVVLFFTLIAAAGLLTPAAAAAQVGSTCVRPLAIPDKWQEVQTGPWDLTDSFDRYDGQGQVIVNPDEYRPPFNTLQTGYLQPGDQGRYFEIRLGSAGGALGATSTFPISLGGVGGTNFINNIVQCSGELVQEGQNLDAEPGNLTGPLLSAVTQLIEADADAFWDPAANGGQGDVAGSQFTFSPRLILLPVFDPDYFALNATAGKFYLRVVRFVGFFIAGVNGTTVYGYLTGRSQLTAESVEIVAGQTGTLAATLDGPGAPVQGVLVDFSVDGNYVTTGVTDADGRAAVPGVDFPGFGNGTFPDVIEAAPTAGFAGFFTADPSSADLTISDAASTTDLAAAPNPSVFGQAVTFTATVSAASQTPVGTVTFFDGQTSIGSATLTPGQGGSTAAITRNNLSAGSHAITASYGGTSGIAASTSNLVTQVVQPAATLTSLVSSVNPSKAGQLVTFTATVAVQAPGVGPATGTVQFLRDGVVVSTATLSNGVATYAVTLGGGKFAFAARFVGGSGLATSTSATVAQVVKGKK